MEVLNEGGDMNGFAPAATAALKIGSSDGAVELGGIAYEVAEVELTGASVNLNNTFDR